MNGKQTLDPLEASSKCQQGLGISVPSQLEVAHNYLQLSVPVQI